jgi:hypothetical protein
MTNKFQSDVAEEIRSLSPEIAGPSVITFKPATIVSSSKIANLSSPTTSTDTTESDALTFDTRKSVALDRAHVTKQQIFEAGLAKSLKVGDKTFMKLVRVITIVSYLRLRRSAELTFYISSSSRNYRPSALRWSEKAS